MDSKPLSKWIRKASLPGLTKLVGDEAAINSIQDGKQSMKCPHCKSNMFPLFSSNGNINCSQCEAFLYYGKVQTKGTYK